MTKRTLRGTNLKKAKVSGFRARTKQLQEELY
jgi:ribosomal protein L34